MRCPNAKVVYTYILGAVKGVILREVSIHPEQSILYCMYRCMYVCMFVFHQIDIGMTPIMLYLNMCYVHHTMYYMYTCSVYTLYVCYVAHNDCPYTNFPTVDMFPEVD